MDEADQAQIMSDRYLNGALNAARLGNNGEASRYCCDCGEKIPEARRRAAPGCRRCIECQREYEDVNV